MGEKHSCEPNYVLESGSYGCAATYCYEDEDGKFWIDNDEYSNTVPFCPFCGEESPFNKLNK